MKKPTCKSWCFFCTIFVINLSIFHFNWQGADLGDRGVAYSAVGSDDFFNKNDEDLIRELVARYAAAREERNPDAIESLFTEDADQLVSSGEWRFGRDNLVGGMLGSSQRNPGDRTITVERIRFIGSNVAIADARYQIKGREGAADRNMWSTFLAVKDGGNWRLTAIRNMLPAP
jgi:uncharacterized protein (TIGR02246 family)